MIRYVKYCGVKREYHEVSHDDIDGWTVKDFETNGMFESLKGLEFVRLYFDFDFHTGDDIITNVDEIIKALDSIKVVFKDYVYAGYCCDKELYNKLPEEFRKSIELKDVDLGKPLSFHVIYPGTVISQDELCEIMTTKLYTHDLKKFADDKPYKKHDKEQLLRHPFAHKYEKPCDKSHKQYKGVNFDNIKCDGAASDLVATPYGNKQIITKEMWSQVFKPVEVKAPEVKKSEAKVDDKDGICDEDIEQIIEESKNTIMSKACFEALYKGFEGLEIHGDAEDTDKEITLFPLFSALYKCINDKITEDDVDDALQFIQQNAKLTDSANKKWTEKLRQAKKNTKCTNPGALFRYLMNFNNEYYIKNVKKYVVRRCVEEEVKFDLKDNFSVKDIRQKAVKREYQIDGDGEKLNYNAVLRDLRKVLIVVDQGDGLYVLKERDARNNRMTINVYNQKTAFSMLKQLKVGTELKKKNYKQDEEHIIETKSAFDVYNASDNNASFYKQSICFFSESSDDFSFYQGYKYDAIRNDVLIEKFNNHIKHIWCKDNEELYNYIQSWFATIIQKPHSQCGTALVVKGIEGTGKNTVTDVWAELLAGYSNSNVSDIDSIVGKFNTALENKKLLVLNEMDSAEMSTTAVFNRLKKLITENSIDIHAKNVSVRTGVQNVSNFVFLSNETNPVKISSTDRRYCVLTPSEEVAGDSDYFDELYDSMKVDYNTYRKEFLEAVMYYYMNYEVKIKLNKIPETLERIIAKDANKGAIESFVEEYCVELSEEGLRPDDAFDMFNRFIAKNKFMSNYKKNTFRAEMIKYCAVDSDGRVSKYKKQRVYRFSKDNIKKYAKIVEEKKAEDCVDDSDSE